MIFHKIRSNGILQTVSHVLLNNDLCRSHGVKEKVRCEISKGRMNAIELFNFIKNKIIPSSGKLIKIDDGNRIKFLLHSLYYHSGVALCGL